MMKQVIVHNLYCVGMHHWGRKELSVGPMYYCWLEENNPKDRNAIAIYSDKDKSHKKGYLRREDAARISPLFSQNFIHGHCYLKATFNVSKYSKEKGPMQNCSIAFKCPDSCELKVRELLRNYQFKMW